MSKGSYFIFLYWIYFLKISLSVFIVPYYRLKGVFLGCIYKVIYWLGMGENGVKFGGNFGVWERERLPRPVGGKGEKKPKIRL